MDSTFRYGGPPGFCGGPVTITTDLALAFFAAAGNFATTTFNTPLGLAAAAATLRGCATEPSGLCVDAAVGLTLVVFAVTEEAPTAVG